jgi:hypothetical protein
MRKYKPSNGTEGEWFIDKYCMNCFHCDPDPRGKKQCMLLCASMCYDVNEPEYPKEWIYDDENKPTCTKWQKWDWDTDGNPDDPDNPNAPQPEDPNQLVMPFILDEIEMKINEKKHEKIEC